MCNSGTYNNITNQCAVAETTNGGWPKPCNDNSQCNGTLGTAGTCSCAFPNINGTGYCSGFAGEYNNIYSKL